MEIEGGSSLYKAKEKIVHTFSDFMLRIRKFDELASVGSRLLVGFQQGLDYLQRLPIEKKNSKLIKHIIRDNKSKRFWSYIEAGCMNADDTVQKTHTCHLGLQNHVNEAKGIVDELACLLKDAEALVQSINCSLAQIDVDNGKDSLETETLAFDEITDSAIMMAIVYSMVKSDYTMQEKIVSSLNLTSPSGELESYSTMWSFRPYIDDQVMHKAWKLLCLIRSLFLFCIGGRSSNIVISKDDDIVD